MKQTISGGLFPSAPSLTDEANLAVAEMGIAPRIAGVETFPGGIGNRMRWMLDNFGFTDQSWFPSGRDAVRVNQQLGTCSEGVLGWQAQGNVVYNKDWPTDAIDFGKSRVKVKQVAALTMPLKQGLAAGLGDVAEIYSATVYDLLAGGDVAEAMDVAKQGFSRLQKIK